MANQSQVDHEVNLLKVHITRLGTKQADGSVIVKYGVLFKDGITQNVFEALLGTLRAAKKRGIVKFAGEMLLSPTHDAVDVILVKEHVPAADAPAASAEEHKADAKK